jgi:siroheme synthase-like protein
MNPEKAEPVNRLFPLFLKLEKFRVLIVGGGLVGLEKLNAILNNAPATEVRIVSIEFHEELRKRAAPFQNILLIQRSFHSSDLDHTDILITALSDTDLSLSIGEQARHRRILINAADKPELCDFYLGSIVQRGNLKIAISTNGKSPTMAKRLKEWLNHVLPDELNDTLDQLNAVRERMRGNMKEKIEKLNEVTKNLLND